MVMFQRQLSSTPAGPATPMSSAGHTLIHTHTHSHTHS